MVITETEKESIMVKLREVLYEHDLQHGNEEVYEQNGSIIMMMEGPEHTTLQVWFEESDVEQLHTDFKQTVATHVAKTVQSFNVDDEFEELWSADFGRHNNFTPTDFMEILNNDKAHFDSVIVNFMTVGV